MTSIVRCWRPSWGCDALAFGAAHGALADPPKAAVKSALLGALSRVKQRAA